jgi:hypothetical protein
LFSSSTVSFFASSPLCGLPSSLFASSPSPASFLR